MDRIGALPKDIKQKNDAEILRSIAGQRVFTVQDIANQTKISRLTITRALERFIEKGIVIQGGKGSSTSLGGKKPQEYSLNDGRYGISIAPSGGETLACLIYMPPASGALHTRQTGDQWSPLRIYCLLCLR